MQASVKSRYTVLYIVIVIHNIFRLTMDTEYKRIVLSIISSGRDYIKRIVQIRPNNVGSYDSLQIS